MGSSAKLKPQLGLEINTLKAISTLPLVKPYFYIKCEETQASDEYLAHRQYIARAKTLFSKIAQSIYCAPSGFWADCIIFVIL